MTSFRKAPYTRADPADGQRRVSFAGSLVQIQRVGKKALSVNKCWSDKLLALRLASIGVYELSYGIVNPRFVDARARLKGENL